MNSNEVEKPVELGVGQEPQDMQDAVYADSEAETEKLHSSPIKRRLSDNIPHFSPKKQKLEPPLVFAQPTEYKEPDNVAVAVPVEPLPAPVEPAPVDSVEPVEPVEPASIEPASIEPAPAPVEPVEPEPVEPEPVEPEPVEPAPVEPTQPTSVESVESVGPASIVSVEPASIESAESVKSMNPVERNNGENTPPNKFVPPVVQPLPDSDDEDDVRQHAIAGLTEIEIEFAKLRDQIHNQHAARLDLEIELTHAGTHPQLAKYSEQIQLDREQKLVQTQKLLNLMQESIGRETHAQRVSCWQTFYKTRGELRNKMIQEVTHKWFLVNKNFCKRDPVYGPKVWRGGPCLSKASASAQSDDIQQIRNL